MHTCLNCRTTFSGKYCPGCGQKADIKRLDTKALIEEFGHFISHIEHHFFRTTKEFIIRPGRNSLDFLKGKRKRYQKPVSFFLIWAAAYILVHNFIMTLFHFRSKNPGSVLPTLQESANEALRSNFTAFYLPALFISALVIYLVLAKPRFNFAEILTLSLFGAGCYNCILLISDIAAGALFRININTNTIFIYNAVVSCIYTFWFCFDLFNKIKLKNFWLRILINAILITGVGWVVFLYAPQAWVILTK